MRFVKPLCFLSVFFLIIIGMAYAQAPVFDTPIYALKDDRDVVLEWEAATGANGYNIYRFEDLPPPVPPGVPLATVTGLEYRDAGAVNAPPYRYYYLVSAFNANGETLAPNMAFKMNIRLYFIPGQSNVNFVSLPQLFFPNGRGTQTAAVDMCDLTTPPGKTSMFGMLIPFQCTASVNFCNSVINNYTIVPGRGYVMVPTEDNVLLDIVGSHDPDLHPGGPNTIELYPWEDCQCTFDMVSIPYHTTAGTAEDICVDLGAAAPDMVARWVTEPDVVITHTCGSPYKDFPIKPGEGLVLRTHATDWQPDVYR